MFPSALYMHAFIDLYFYSIHALTLFLYFWVAHVIVKGKVPIDDSLWRKLNDPVAHGLCKLMVTCGQDHGALKVF